MLNTRNIFGEDDKELFQFDRNGFIGSAEDFAKKWGGMNGRVCEAVIRVALQVNPVLDVGYAIWPKPMDQVLPWLRKTAPDVYAQMIAWSEDQAAKNATRPGAREQEPEPTEEPEPEPES